MESEEQKQLDDLVGVKAQLGATLSHSLDTFYSAFKKLKLPNSKDRVFRAVIRYPHNHDETIEREDEKTAVAAGMAFMQIYGEWCVVDGITGLVRSHIKQQQPLPEEGNTGEENGSTDKAEN